ncbi:MAG: hypothetical protein CVV13_03565 [Gammaproteobacteria bacterium HGW-Gammaproteobacteria-3]|nr:MAG: hypothetical protein CVV13_03565 [Gammaproteobacteria bacterium HGW-Gammaproteobacteria-3]
MTHPELYLRKNENKRLRQGHQWIFSHEIDAFSPGGLVYVRSASRCRLNCVVCNPTVPYGS